MLLNFTYHARATARIDTPAAMKSGLITGRFGFQALVEQISSNQEYIT
jgi:hypothetical protein